MSYFEICEKCYCEDFPIYEDMQIEVTKEKHKCMGCGKRKLVVRKVYSGNELVDVN